jgi:hypothetical protein
MKNIKLYIAFLILNGMAFSAMAQKNEQDSLDDGLTVNIKYVPTLSESIKIPVNPNPEQPVSVKPTFTYKVPDLNTETTPTIYTIKPISLGNMLLPKLRNNYFRFGYGNYNMPLAEGYVNSLRNKTWNNGLFFKHLSGNGDRDFNNFSNNTLGLNSTKFLSNTVLSTSFLYHRNVVYNYGFVNDVKKPLEDTLKNIYNLVDFNIALENIKTDTNAMQYKFGINYYYQGNNFDMDEHNFKIMGNISKKINDIPFSLYTGINSITNIIKGNSQQRTAFVFNPRINLEDENYYLKVGFNYTYFTDSLNNKETNHFYPIGEAAYHVIPKVFTVLAGVNGNYHINNFRNISAENPFVRNYQFRNTNNKFEMYLGIKGNIANGLNYSLQGSIANIANLLFYVQDSSSYQQIIYDEGNVTLTTLTADISYQIGEKWRVGVISKFYGYSTSKLQFAYSRPNTEVKLNTSYNIGDKFMLRSDIFYIGKRTGGVINPTSGNKDNISEIKLNPFVDLNLGIDYRYNKNVSVFVNFNNMAAARYMRFTNYDVYGFNAMGGVTLTF